MRHGETGSNVSKRHQPSTSRLNDHGREQARAVAHKLAALSATHFYASSQVRAVETAEIISHSLDLSLQLEHVFTELNRPQHMYGWHHRDPRSLWYLMLWYLGFAGAVDDQEAGESYHSLRKRVLKAQSLLASHPADATIIVVSHSVFINMFIAHMCQPSSLRPWQMFSFLRRVKMTKNTDILHVRYENSDNERRCEWQHVVQ